MKQNLKKILEGMSDVDFRELLSAISIANFTQKTMRKYDINIDDLSAESGLTTLELTRYVMGTHGYSILTITKVDCALSELAKPKIDAIKIKEPSAIEISEGDK